MPNVILESNEAATQQKLYYSFDSSWLSQYHADKIAALLMERRSSDDDTDDAGIEGSSSSSSLQAAIMVAGERVQSQALARTARRQVRAFLRERDVQWGVQRSVGRQTTTTTRQQAPALEQQEEGGAVAQVVDLLLHRYQFTIKDVVEIFTHTPGVALMRACPSPLEQNATAATTRGGETLQETTDRVFVELLSETLGLRRYDARKVVRNCPGLLTMRGSKAAEQMVQLLVRLGVSTRSLTRDTNALPVLLSRSPSAVFRLVAFLASDAVRMPVQRIGPLLRRSECQELLNAIAPVAWLEADSEDDSQGVLDGEDHGDDDDDDVYVDPGVLAALWGRQSQLRRERINDTYRNMSKTAWALRHQIGTADLGKVIAAYPSVLLLDAQEQILPAANYLMNDLGIWQDDLPRVLQLYPALLGMDVAEMEKVVSYLVDLGVDQENLGIIFRAFPALLTLSIERDMEPVAEFLRSIGISNIGRFITRLPPVLGYSIERELQPKWDFLQKVCVDPRFEVTRFPAYFSYPLDRVIRTRFEYLQNEKNIPTALLSLDEVLRFGDKDFAVKVARDDDGGLAFAAFSKVRQPKRTVKRWRQKQR